MIKEAVSFIEKVAEKDSKRKKNKDAKKAEDGIVRRLAKNGLDLIYRQLYPTRPPRCCTKVRSSQLLLHVADAP